MSDIKVKGLKIHLIDASSANKYIKKNHYSGKVVANSCLHFGVFHNKILYGVMQFGPPMVKRLMLPFIEGAGWNDILELNRMYFEDLLPKNSESRSIAVALRIIKKNKPSMKAVFSFADGCQCGDGTIYRASGFYLTQIKKNTGLSIDPKTGIVTHQIAAWHKGQARDHGSWEKLKGYQFRYIHTLGNGKEILKCPILPFSKIKEIGAAMYKGKKI